METTLSIHLAYYAKNEFGLFTITYKDKWSWALLNVSIHEDYGSVAWFTFTISNK